MKKIILAAILCIASTALVKAQGSKGNLFVGSTLALGSFSYNSGNETDTYPDGNYGKYNSTAYSLGIDPALGAFLSDHFILGGNLSIDYDNDKVTGTNTETLLSNYSNSSNSTTYRIGPFIRYYFFDDKPSTTLFYLSASAGLGGGSGSSSLTSTNPSGTNTSTANMNGIFTYDVGGALGITHYVAKNIGLDFSIGYSYMHEKYTENQGVNATASTLDYGSSGSGVTLMAGFHFILP